MANHDVYAELIQRNKQWAEEQTTANPHVFDELAKGQSPPFLFIGCADSRKAINTLTQTGPGKLFIHRNIANQIRPDDQSIQATLEYAIEVLKVQHIIVCGHKSCGGVTDAYTGNADNHVKDWIQPIRELYLQNKDTIDGSSESDEDRINELAVLNIKKGIETIQETTAYKNAANAGHAPELHGWLLGIDTGRITEVVTKSDHVSG